MKENTKPTDPSEPEPNPEIDEFFRRLPGNLHWPPPSEAAIAAAVEAVQRMAGSAIGNTPPPETAGNVVESAGICGVCGHRLAAGMRFCGNCGSPIGEQATASNEDWSAEAGAALVERLREPDAPALDVQQTVPGAQHHYHHHYHHFVGTPGNPPVSSQQDSGAPHGRASTTGASGSRAELAARQLAQDWAQACNTKHLDDLVELYTPDATLIRPNVLPVRSAPSIREFLFAALEAGLGDVEMSSLRTEIFGEIALDLGRCKMLVPVAMGKRREERGKYLLVMARQPAGHWKIIADCWSTDLSVSAAPAIEARKPNDAALKKPR